MTQPCLKGHAVMAKAREPCRKKDSKVCFGFSEHGVPCAFSPRIIFIKWQLRSHSELLVTVVLWWNWEEEAALVCRLLWSWWSENPSMESPAPSWEGEQLSTPWLKQPDVSCWRRVAREQQS